MSSSELDPLALARTLGLAWALVTRTSTRGESLLLPGGSAGLAGEQLLPTNWVVVHGPEGVERAVRAFAGRLRERELPGLIAVSPAVAAQAATVARELRLTSDEPVPLMVCAAGSFRPRVAPGGIQPTVVRTADDRDVEAVAAVLADAFGASYAACRGYLGTSRRDTPQVDFFLAALDGHAAAALTTARVDDVVGVFAMGTRPGQRRQGAAGAALTGAMRYHLERGAAAFVLQTSTMGRLLYESLGFRVVEESVTWLVLPGTR